MRITKAVKQSDVKNIKVDDVSKDYYKWILLSFFKSLESDESMLPS